MTTKPVISPPTRKRLDPRVLLAFFAIYVLWGSTFLAIRMAVLLVPPWFAAGTRFFTAGTILYVFTLIRGEQRPTLREWRSLALIGVLMFSVTYGALFWAEQFVPSGITSVLEATLPLITVVLEVFIFRQQRFRWRILFSILIGFCGVALMLLKHDHQAFGIFPCLVVLGGSVCWSLGSVLTRSLPLPTSRVLTAGAEMMLGGGLLLVISAVSGELHPFPHLPPRAVFSLIYLIVAGSLMGFTAFVWLLGRMPASKVASHAYVNPIVAIALGHFVLSEQVTARTLLGAALVIGSVFLTMKEEKTEKVEGAHDPQPDPAFSEAS
jgi:drug/metabolite transporter (DMT)-like permease